MTTLAQTSQDRRSRITITGIVQGVGFRPFIYNLACQHQVTGYVRNVGSAVEIEIQAPAAKIASFLEHVSNEAPPLSVIEQIETLDIPPNETDNRNFEILQSTSTDKLHKAVSPDMATCDDCLNELFNPDDRRYRYPFINCTNCGPRFTIIEKLPYDRPLTSMSEFAMCDTCLAEYQNPSNRRFHAQPNACANCGPTLHFVDNSAGMSASHSIYAEPAITKAVQLVSQSGILAVKGLGGFHIVCDAQDDKAIDKLRQRKRRSEKPLALMMTDTDMVRQYCRITDAEAALLTSPERPIVLLAKLDETQLSQKLAPGNAFLGVMLPYTPIHHLLLKDLMRPLVCTSGNLSEEPIATDNDDAIDRLAGIVDGYLLHNRQILSRYDDSVCAVIENNPTIVRRSRGFAPKSINTHYKTNKQVLALGAQLKNTFCLYKDKHAYLSQHIGDLENFETLQHFEEALARMQGLLNFQPDIIACDLHPNYLSSDYGNKLAHARNLPLVKVQHHHAHIVSCMVENQLKAPVIGVAFDGLGYGTDGNMWGGEFLICHYDSFNRNAHLSLKHMPGGSLAIRQPWRMAASYLLNVENEATHSFLNTCRQLHGDKAVQFALQQMHKQINSPLTSSAGRLFDAVASALNIRHVVTFEGQAAIELESYGHDWLKTNKVLDNEFSYPFTVNTAASPFVIETSKILPAILNDQMRSISNAEISYRFHLTVAKIISDTCLILRDNSGINQICLSGGVFQNKLLLQLTLNALRENNLDVFIQHAIPANDGGISLGQAVIAAAQAERMG